MYLPKSHRFKNKLPAIGFILPVALFVGVFLAAPAFAETQNPDHPAQCTTDDGQQGVWLAITIGGRHCIANPPPTNNTNVDITKNVIFGYLKDLIKFLTGGAGVLAVGGVVWGGISYSMAKGNPGQIQKSIKIILNSLLGLLLFFLLAAIFNYLIPGGLFT